MKDSKCLLYIYTIIYITICIYLFFVLKCLYKSMIDCVKYSSLTEIITNHEL